MSSDLASFSEERDRKRHQQSLGSMIDSIELPGQLYGPLLIVPLLFWLLSDASYSSERISFLHDVALLTLRLCELSLVTFQTAFSMSLTELDDSDLPSPSSLK
jgi:hypothetical protein